MRRQVLAIALFLALSPISLQVWALATEHFGINHYPEGAFSEWKGVVPVINHSSGVYHTWVNGNEHFYFRGDTNALNDSLKKFAAIWADIREVIIQPGPAVTDTFEGEPIRHLGGHSDNW